jgi:hypothetical protein
MNPCPNCNPEFYLEVINSGGSIEKDELTISICSEGHTYTTLVVTNV